MGLCPRCERESEKRYVWKSMRRRHISESKDKKICDRCGKPY